MNRHSKPRTSIDPCPLAATPALANTCLPCDKDLEEYAAMPANPTPASTLVSARRFLTRQAAWVLLALIGSLTAITAFAAPDDCPGEMAGQGTESAPCEITTRAQLESIKDQLGLHYQLMKSIDLSGENWVRIGDFSNPFTGSFDGRGHTIDNLTINITVKGQSYQGLFGVTEGTIKNIGLTNVSVISHSGNVGSLAGRNSADGKIINAYATGSVTLVYPPDSGTQQSFAGGLVGDNHGEIDRSYTSVTATGHRIVGGLVGINRGAITRSYATGNVTAIQHTAGGLVGNNFGEHARIENSYATGDVSINKPSSYPSWWTYDYSAGGLAGSNRNEAAIINSYATGAVTSNRSGSGRAPGGLVSLGRDAGGTPVCQPRLIHCSIELV